MRGRVKVNLRGVKFTKEGENRYSCKLGGHTLRFYLSVKLFPYGQQSTLILDAVDGHPVALYPCVDTALDIMTAMPCEAFA